jgi:UDP-N-acetylmuramyl pentapeptide phosphotransferase/UDP-N-acetylglucosamine-1-phosphate transferase
MPLFILSFLTSLLATLAVIRSSGFHSRLTADHDLSGPQKFHARAVPRIGGIGVVIAIGVAGIFATVASIGPGTKGFVRPQATSSDS